MFLYIYLVILGTLVRLCRAFLTQVLTFSACQVVQESSASPEDSKYKRHTSSLDLLLGFESVSLKKGHIKAC